MIATDYIFGRKYGSVINFSSNPMIVTVDTNYVGSTASTQLRLPVILFTSGDPVRVVSSAGHDFIITGGNNNPILDFSIAGVYDISMYPVSGSGFNFQFLSDNDKKKLIEIKQWGDRIATDNYQAFRDASNLNLVSATDLPYLPGYCRQMFRGVGSCNINRIAEWDFSGVNSIDEFFFGAVVEGDFSLWDVSNIVDMSSVMRGNTYSNNVDFSKWDISKVTDMYYAFPSLQTNYAYLDAIYNTWVNLPPKPNIQINFGAAKYTAAGQAARDTLVNTYAWSIGDGGLA